MTPSAGITKAPPAPKAAANPLLTWAAQHVPPLYANLTITPEAARRIFKEYGEVMKPQRAGREYWEASALLRAGAPMKEHAVLITRSGRLLTGIGLLTAIADTGREASVFAVVNVDEEASVTGWPLNDGPAFPLGMHDPFDYLQLLGATRTDIVEFLNPASQAADTAMTAAVRQLLPAPRTAPAPVSTISVGGKQVPIGPGSLTVDMKIPATVESISFDTVPFDFEQATVTPEPKPETAPADDDQEQTDTEPSMYADPPNLAEVSFGVRLQREGIRNGVALAAIGRRIILHKAGLDIADASRPHAVSDTALRELFEENTHLRSATDRATACNRQLGLTVGPLGFASWYIDTYAPQTVDVEHGLAKFFADLATGANLPEGDPVLILRARIFERRAGRVLADMNEATQVAYLVAAWNYRRAGKSISKFSIPATGYSSTHNSGYPIPR
jgi:hypothetical protein